ncbi:MAG: TOBE domain-containing protein, partial [Spirochaetota bacterium]
VVLDGRVRQVGSYQEILAAPESQEVARFLGNRNWFSGIKRGREVSTDIGTVLLPKVDTPDGAVWISIRPEDLRPGGAGPFRVRGEVVRSVSFGSHSNCRIRVGTQDLDMTIPAGKPVPRGTIEASFDPAKVIVLAANPD